MITLEGIMKFEDNTLSLTEHQNLHVDYEVSLDSLEPYEITKEYLASLELDEVKNKDIGMFLFRMYPLIIKHKIVSMRIWIQNPLKLW